MSQRVVALRAYTCFALVHFQDLHKENVENDLQVCRTREDTGGLLDDWLAAVKKLREEVLKKYTKYDTPAWNIKFSSYFLDASTSTPKAK